MDELNRFITETSLWLTIRRLVLTIVYLAVFAAMWIWCLVLLVQALRKK